MHGRYSSVSVAAPAFRALTRLAVTAAILMAAATARSQPTDIRWGTAPVGSTGHKALVVLADLLHREMPELRVSVLPYPGATVKNFALGEIDGYYTSDVALKELESDRGRFKGFKPHVRVQPVQSLWCFTVDVGLAIKAGNRGAIAKWADLEGKPVYTGPLAFDVRSYLEDALAAVGVRHIYKQVDLTTAGSQLSVGSIDAMLIYAAGGQTPPPWLSQASLAVDWAALNPSADEIERLAAQGFGVVEVDPANFHRDLHVRKAILLPSYFGFSLGMKTSADEMYKLLTIVETHADELARVDPSFREIGRGQMPAFEKRALQATWRLAAIHPGLARYMKERGVWESRWDAMIARMP